MVPDTILLTVNGKAHYILIVPYAQFLPVEVLEGIAELIEKGCPVIFLNHLPDAACTGEAIPDILKTCPVVDILELQDAVLGRGLESVQLMPKSNRIRALYSKGGEEVVYLFNEADKTYTGTVTLPWTGNTYIYNAWDNCAEQVQMTENGALVTLRPSESCILVRGTMENAVVPVRARETEQTLMLEKFTVSCCRSIEYPEFKPMGEIALPQSFDAIAPDFSGFIAYETKFTLEGCSRAILEITDAHEGVEVFVNGESAGMEIIPEYRFDITDWCRAGENTLRIEVATTLERENGVSTMFGVSDPAPTGITGTVTLRYSK